MCSAIIGASEKEKGEIESIEKSFSFEVFFIFFRVENRTFNRRDDEKALFSIAAGEYQWIIQGNSRKFVIPVMKNKENSSAGFHQRRWCRKKIMQFDTQRRAKCEMIKFKRFFFPFQFDGKCNFGPNKETQRKYEFLSIISIFLLFLSLIAGEKKEN